MSTWQHWLNLVVGLWIIVSSYLGFSADQMVTNFTVSGIIVAILAVWGALQNSTSMSRRDERTHMHA